MKENKLKRFFVSPFRGLIKSISSSLYIKLEYKYITGHKLNLKNPERFTEKLQVLRLKKYPNNKDVVLCSSKATVRDYLKENNLEKYLTKSHGVFDSFDQIDFSKLPTSFVIKCSHGCGMNIIVQNKNELDIDQTKKIVTKWLKTDYGKKTAEPHYSKIKPQILIEEYLGESPTEYKINVINGKANYIYVVTGRNKDIHYNNLHLDWTPFDEAQFNGWNSSKDEIHKPENFDEMIKLAEKLSQPFPFVRVDLYNINGKIYFGEMTFTPAKGTLKFDDDRIDFTLGKILTI